MATALHTRDYKEFAALLRTIREEAEMTQAQLGQRMHLPQGRISQIERAQRRIDIIELRRICRACGVTLPQFIDRLEKALGGR